LIPALESRGGDPVSGPSAPVAAAYGIRVEGLGAPSGLALRGAEAWPTVHFTRELTGEALPRQSEVRGDGATIVNPAATLLVDRERAAVRVLSAAPVPEPDLVHPCLWPVGAVFARWRGAETLHAGAFAQPGGEGAWAVMADSRGGKTSFLAMLALAGAEVLTDDLLVVEGGECVAGPRSLDLRPEVVERLAVGDRATTPVRSTSRCRMDLAPCDGRWPVAGFVELAWGDPVTVQRLEPAAGLAALARHRRVQGLGTEFAQLLALVDRPILRVARPHGWGSADEAVQRLLEAIDGLRA
jgi:hypothetical protein